MINPLVISEIKTVESPLAELSKSFETLPDRELNKSLGENNMGIIPRSGGSWSGEPGNSTWNPDREIEPKNRNYSNVEGKNGIQFLKKMALTESILMEENLIFQRLVKELWKLTNLLTSVMVSAAISIKQTKN